MKYSESELKLILDKYPKYRKKNQLSLNDAIVAFLKKYEVYVTPPKSNNALDGAITGAVTGMAGADEALLEDTDRNMKQAVRNNRIRALLKKGWEPHERPKK